MFRVEYNGRTFEEYLLKCRVWLRQHFSYVYTEHWAESRFSFTLSLTGSAQKWVQARLTAWLSRDLRKQMIDEITLARGIPSHLVLSDTPNEPKSPGIWYDELPDVEGRVTVRPIDHPYEQRRHARPVR